VLPLITADLTNRQIGQRLSLDEDIVSAHISSLLIKLGLAGGTHGTAAVR
jgi:DNA-binding NarL/FixJ family response regulator